MKLLRCGATVIATTRFPNDATARYAVLPDFATWRDRLHVYGCDLRDIASLEAFCATLCTNYDRLDIIINNACQTVRRPPVYYEHLIGRERQQWNSLPDAVKPVLVRDHAFRLERQRALAGSSDSRMHSAAGGTDAMQMLEDATRVADTAGRVRPAVDLAEGGGSGGVASTGGCAAASAEASQLVVIESDMQDRTLFPQGKVTELSLQDCLSDLCCPSVGAPLGMVDVNAQQLDLRTVNSWMLKLDQVWLRDPP